MDDYRYRYEREVNYRSDREREMLEHIAYLEDKCRRIEHYTRRSDEDILYNMDINVIEKFLRKKKLETLNKK